MKYIPTLLKRTVVLAAVLSSAVSLFGAKPSLSFNCNATINIWLNENDVATIDPSREDIKAHAKPSTATLSFSKSTFTSADDPGTDNPNNDFFDYYISVTASNGTESVYCSSVKVKVHKYKGKSCNAPSANCKNITLSLVDGEATLAPSDIDNGSTADCGLASMTVSKSAFTCSDNGNNSVVLTITDTKGQTSSCTATVTVNVITSASVSANRTVVYWGAPLGYNSATLTASGTGGSGYSYSWSPSGTGNPITVSPTTNTTYTATVTDNQGCAAKASINICVVDVRCGNNLDKVQMCKAYGTPQPQICVSVNAVQTQLNNGGSFGACAIVNNGGYTCTQGPNSGARNFSDATLSSQLVAMPNPFNGTAMIQFSTGNAAFATVKVYTIAGAEVATIFNENVKSNEQMVVSFTPSNPSITMYIVRMTTNTGIQKSMYLISK